ncbi:hypothetical protein [Bowmanella denitrificans]|uniref:hypothetical protein n=1 Tax=Bowmanella denitrificans TaxID=366582 RepID=UPI000C9C54BC|nr:hypothetical protein [Bowmanella denitrificans]
MNAHAMLTKILSLVSFNMHKARQKALIACTQSLLAGNVATVTSMGRGICSKAFEKHRIKWADRLLSNQHLLSEVPSLYMAVSHLFRRKGSDPH